MINIAVFASGKGTNLQAIIDALNSGEIKANLALVISDCADAYALVRAKEAGIKHVLLNRKDFKSRENFEQEIIRNLKQERVDLIVLAGFMRLLSGEFVRSYPNKILNIHPALLPSFKGTEGIKDALEYGVKVSGATVHFVDQELDHGPVVLQAAVEVEDTDTEETLAEKIHQAEYRIYPEAIKLFVEGKLSIEGRKVKILAKEECGENRKN